MKKGLILFLVCILSHMVYAQSTMTDTSYQIRYNDPYTYPKVNINLLVGFANGMSVNQPLGGGGELDFLNKYVTIMVNYRFAYPGYDQSHDKHTPTTSYSSNNLKLYNSYEAMLAYHFSDKLKKGSIGFTPGGPDKEGEVKVIKIPIQYRRIYAVRGGWYNYTTALKGDDTHPLKSVSADYGPHYFTNMNTGSAFLGLMTQKVSKIGIKDYRANRRHRQVMSFYADAMYAPMIKLDPLQIGGKSIDISNTPVTKLGWRLGMQDQVNVLALWRLEVGMLPGLAGRTLYGDFTIGITLFGRGKRDLLEKEDFGKHS